MSDAINTSEAKSNNPSPTLEVANSNLGGMDLESLLAPLDEWVASTIQKNPSIAKEVLAEKKLLKEGLISDTGEVSREILRKEFTFTQKMSLLASLLFNETIGVFMPDLGRELLGNNLEISSFESRLNEYKSMPGITLSGTNLIHHDESGLMGGINKLIRLSSYLAGAKGQEKIKLNTGCTWILSQTPSDSFMTISYLGQLRRALTGLTPPVKLSIISPQEASRKIPDANEIQIVKIQDTLLTDMDGKPDSKAMQIEEFSTLFERGNCEWSVPNTLGAVLSSKGSSADDIIKALGYSAEDPKAISLHTVLARTSEPKEEKSKDKTDSKAKTSSASSATTSV